MNPKETAALQADKIRNTISDAVYTSASGIQHLMTVDPGQKADTIDLAISELTSALKHAKLARRRMKLANG